MPLSLIKSLFIFSAWLPSKILHIYDHGVHEHASLITFEWVGCFQPNLRARKEFQSCHVATSFMKTGNWMAKRDPEAGKVQSELSQCQTPQKWHCKGLTLGRASMESYNWPRDRKSQYTKSHLNIYSEGHHNKSQKNDWPSRYSIWKSRQDS